MEVVIVPTADDVATVAADAIERLVRREESAVLGVATGSSPLGIYAQLVDRYRAGRITFRRATAFLLDEYVGLPPDHPQSYRAFIERHFAGLVDFAPGAVSGPDALARDIPAACAAYEAAIRAAGGVDLQLLGIGSDGHIGFNEPVSSLSSRTRVKTLTQRTREDNSRFFSDPEEEVPRHVVTQGIGTILEARHLILVATGPAKADAICRAVEGPLAAICPASAIQLHPHASIVVDEAAAAALTLADYYRDARQGKPAWQSL